MEKYVEFPEPVEEVGNFYEQSIGKKGPSLAIAEEIETMIEVQSLDLIEVEHVDWSAN